MPSPVAPLHAGPDPAGIHPRVFAIALLLAVATAVALYVLVGLLGPDGRGEGATERTPGRRGE